ncbi:hypothetical protein [Candidatus Magnetominusculus dajiuhuensis]|uniref:hypothetical protein n=1 Tax=Candidatus Magnetominusculus dajiuhuensis TaxID=3137712 RepID=UPI003B436C0E
MNAKEVVVTKGSRPLDLMDEDEQVSSLIQALRQHGKIDLPMNTQFEERIKAIRQMTSEIKLPYYT